MKKSRPKAAFFFEKGVVPHETVRDSEGKKGDPIKN